MMIYLDLHWSEHNERDLWPQALSPAAYLHNKTPHLLSWLSPTELYYHIKPSHSALINAHPWGCPMYILQYHLQYGVKTHKWEPWSRRGQYMDVSLLHTSTVGIIRNLNTNRMITQFHVV